MCSVCQYLCKTYPSVCYGIVLLLMYFLFGFLNSQHAIVFQFAFKRQVSGSFEMSCLQRRGTPSHFSQPIRQQQCDAGSMKIASLSYSFQELEAFSILKEQSKTGI